MAFLFIFVEISNMATDKKPFSETKFAQFLERAKPVMGKVLEGVGAVTGKDVFTNVGKMLNDHSAETPEQAAIIAEFNQEKANFELEFSKIENERLQMELADTQSARNTEIERLKATGGKRDYMMGIVLCVVLLAYIGVIVFLMTNFTILPDKMQMFNMGIGQVFTFAGMVVGYYFGTSKSSRTKDETIKAATNK